MKNIRLYLLFLFILNSCGVDYQLKIAKKFEEKKQYQQAIEKYREIINKYPEDKYVSISQLTIAERLYKLSEYKQSKVEYENFQKRFPSGPKSAEISEEIKKIDKIILLLEDGQKKLTAGELEESVKNYEDVLKIDPDSNTAKKGIAEVKRLEQEKVEEAKRIEQANNNLKKEIEKSIFDYCGFTALFTIKEGEPNNNPIAGIAGHSCEGIFEGKNIELTNVSGTSDIEIVVKLCEVNANTYSFEEDFFGANGVYGQKIKWYKDIFQDWFHIPSLQEKISKVILELYRLKVKEEKVDSYGNITLPRENQAKRIKVIEIRRTPETEKINWDNISNDNLEKIVNRSTRVYLKPGEWFLRE